MKKWVILTLLLVLVFLPLISFVSAGTFDEEIKKITYYAEEYETGNIDYARLIINLGIVREKLNEKLGAAKTHEGDMLKQEQVKTILGEPREYTKWVWVEKENQEEKLDEAVPAWDKIVFDGKKIQIRLSAYPALFKKESGNKLIYRLHFQIDFKKPQDKLDVRGKIEEIKNIAGEYNSNPTEFLADKLAMTSVSTEKLFQDYFRQSGGKCVDTMQEIFGSENFAGTEKIYSEEIIIDEGGEYEARLNLEMCEDCKWNWININFWVDSKGKMKLPEEKWSSDEKEFRDLSNEEYKTKTTELVSEIKADLEGENFASAMEKGMKLNQLTNEWNRISNDVWKQVEAKFDDKLLSEEERQKIYENYGWINREQEKRRYMEELSQTNFEKRKNFYENLFSGYEKKESYYEETRFEKRLIESFIEFGRETCNNNLDDNNDGFIDCSESTCSSQLCGKSFESVIDGNETKQVERNLYCIEGMCQAKEEPIEIITYPVCGNNICEKNESLSCLSDCVSCPVYDAIKCDGKVMFSGYDGNNCPLEPICINEEISCSVNEDCRNPLCGEASCIDGTCKIMTLSECREAECSEGEKKIKSCASGEELVESICKEGMWKSLGLECDGEEIEIIEEVTEILSNECAIVSDCGGENDVCSNGKCVSLPKSTEGEIEEEISEEIPVEENEIQEESGAFESGEDEIFNEGSNEPEIVQEVTGNFLMKLFVGLTKLTGYEIIEGEGDENPESIPKNPPEPERGTTIPDSGTIFQPENLPKPEGGMNSPSENSPEPEYSPEEDNYKEDRKSEEEARREAECEEKCSRECYDMKVRPCVEDCIWQECSDELECTVEEVKKSCESKCTEENNIVECENTCESKCLKGENTWQEPERKEQMIDNGGFQAGGSCRSFQGRTEGNIWFGGWGENFERIEQLKQKYFMGGQNDWCKMEYENLLRQRKELEKGLNEEFSKWFFETHLASSAENWEDLVSGIYELYWSDVSISREMAFRMQCAEIKNLSEYNLINFSYESEYGSVEFWEEIKEVELEELDGEKVQIISPYMKIWVFPPKEFIKYEMKKSVENHKFPGKSEDRSERENEEGLREEEKEFIKQDKSFMKIIKEISEKYGGNFDGVVQIKDFEKDEIVFNMKVEVNENDILKMEPMPYSEVTEEDARIEIDFEDVFDLIYMSEKEMREERIESPPWDKKETPIQKIKEMTNGVKSFFKIRGMINSAKIVPEEARGDVKKLLNAFMKMMMRGEENSKEESSQ